tara:strand:- start:5627 stop:6421 length:795 start_codon:yes stop_codon:yes gene_type:complete
MDKKYNFLKPIKNENLVRLGRAADGGYIVDKSIVKNCDVLVTFGMGPDWSFELDYIKKNPKVKIFMYDYTVSSLPYIKEILKYTRRLLLFRAKIKDVTDRIKYLKYYLSFLNLKCVKFFSEKITFPIQKKIDTDIDKVFSRLSKEAQVVLKSDIEGSEFEIIDQINKYSSRIEMLIFEFHWLNKNEEIFLESINKLKKNFNIIHIHGNNHCKKLPSGLPITLEMTFLNKKNHVNKGEYVKNFPIKNLDFPNNPYLKDLNFSFED